MERAPFVREVELPVYTGLREKERASSRQPKFLSERKQRVEATEPALRFLLGFAPGRQGALQQLAPLARDPVRAFARAVRGRALEPALGAHPLQVAAQCRVVELQ